MPPCVLRFNLFGIYPFPGEYAHLCQIWCQSVQSFGSFSRICAKLVRLLATGRAVSRKKQHLCIENYNSGPNMQTSMSSLTFFTAIFVALGGALAEELMICCRHVRTVYRYLSNMMSLLSKCCSLSGLKYTFYKKSISQVSRMCHYT